FATAIEEGFTCIREKCHSRWKSGVPRLTSDFSSSAASGISRLSIFSSDAEKVCPVLRNRSRNPQPSHLRQERGPFQSQFGGCTAGSAYDPAGLLKRLHHQSAI